MEGLPARAEIYLGSDLQESIDLTSPIPLQFSLDQRPGVTFEIFEDGSIAFAGSDCPDKICVHSGRLGIPGQSAACIPNLLFIRIVSAAEDESGGYPDIISG